MRRVAILIGVIVGVAIGGVVATTSLVGTTAQEGQDEQAIHIQVSSARDDAVLDYKDGDSCIWSMGSGNLLFTSPQLVVRDETDTIVAMYTLDAGTIDITESTGTPFCVDDVVIPVPDASYYTLYLASLEEVRVMGYSADELPNDGTDVIFLDPEFH